MMRTFTIILIFGLITTAYPIGVGIILGEPTGLSFKSWITEINAIDFGIGWSFTRERIHLVADYLFHFPEWIQEPNWYPYLGLGGRLKMKRTKEEEWEFNLGARFGIGIEYIYQRFGFFGELYPVMDLVPETDFDLEGGIGARFYFRK
ncbi:hypothetical protein DRP53_00400 [candidate division WOR-3 bacterium]|uniref:DUF3996 domain-containing protein n=1 Tax=candidate division WOR-3 bacterium TaxID=2052148 RepID=A0A660SP82_UNCW3|nr:MAG: hypothetical protein DRP53_00400 [candidate division WOR-3 bacterium]